MIHLKLPVGDHLAWFCTRCQTTWAVVNSSLPLKEHIMFWSDCEACSGGQLTGFTLRYPSLELAIVNDILAALPYDLLVREFLLYLEELADECECNTVSYDPGGQSSIVEHIRQLHIEGG